MSSIFKLWLNRLTQQVSNRFNKADIDFQYIFENAALASTIIDGDGLYIKTNRAFNTLFGVSSTSNYFIRNHFSSILHPDEIDKSKLMFERLISAEIRTFKAQRRYIHPTTLEIIHGITTISLVKDLAGKFLYALEKIEDITHFVTTKCEDRKIIAAYENILTSHVGDDDSPTRSIKEVIESPLFPSVMNKIDKTISKINKVNS